MKVRVPIMTTLTAPQEARTAERTALASRAGTATQPAAAREHGSASQSAYDALLSRIAPRREPDFGQ